MNDVEKILIKLAEKYDLTQNSDQKIKLELDEVKNLLDELCKQQKKQIELIMAKIEEIYVKMK